jgi:glycosyltransferase involved in cell wall biosynthesis
LVKARVASVTYDYYPFDIRVRRLAEAAVDAGHEMDVICLRQENEAAREVYHGVTIHRVPFARGFNLSLLLTAAGWVWFTLLAGWYLSLLMLRRRYDVIHVHNMPDFLVFVALIPRLLGARVILDVQDVSPELLTARSGAKSSSRTITRRIAELQERLATKFADIVVTVGWPFEEKLLERGAPRDKLRIIINSADPKLFPPTKRFSPDDALELSTLPHDASAPFIIMYWGTLEQRNGLATAVRALAIARKEVPTIRLDIMGRGSEIPSLLALAKTLGVGDAVFVTDAGPAERIVDFICHGDVGVIPYLIDGFADLVLPTKAYEAAWVGRPIIASDTPAIRSMFRSESMLLCEAENAEAFARAFVELAQRPDLRRELVANARNDYEPYRWEKMARRYADLLAWLATTPRGALRLRPEMEVA